MTPEQTFAKLATSLMPVETDADAEQLIASLLVPVTSPHVIAFANAHAFNLAVKDAAFYDSLQKADILLRDGVGVKWLLTMQKMSPGLNMNGTDLIPRILNSAIAPQCRIALIGATAEVVAKAKATLRSEGVNIVFAVDGYRQAEEYITLLDQYPVDICLLAMGMPRQEILAQRLKAMGRHNIHILCGGAVLDFYTKSVSRAPRWMQTSGLEWLYRFYQEPKRLFKRYILGNPMFLQRALRCAFKKPSQRV